MKTSKFKNNEKKIQKSSSQEKKLHGMIQQCDKIENANDSNEKKLSKAGDGRGKEAKRNPNIKKMAVSGLLCALCVIGSMFSFPVFASKCAPVQHMVNVLCAIFLGPGYGLGVAFTASLIRNIAGLGSLMAFPGSMFGALLCSVVYKTTGKILPTLFAEVFGTSVLGGLAAYPVSVFMLGKNVGDIAFYSYIVPFMISSVVGALISGILVFALKKSGFFSKYLSGGFKN